MIDYAPIAEKLGRDLAIIAEQIWQVAEQIDKLGNRGIAEVTLSAAGLPIDFLSNKEALPAIDGILFYRVSEGRRDPFEGWMVRRKPSWQSVWCDRFGNLNPDDDHGCKALAAMSEAARRAADEQEPRPSETVIWARARSVTNEDLQWQAQIAAILVNAMHRNQRDQVIAWRQADYFTRGARTETLADALARLFEQWHSEASGELSWRERLQRRIGKPIRRAPFEFPESLVRRIESGEVTLNELAAVVIARPMPPLPEVLHVDDPRYERLPDSEKVYIDKKTRKHSASTWQYPFKANKEEGGLIRWRRYAEWLRAQPDLLGQLEDLRGKRALGVLYKSPYYDYDTKEEVGHGEALVELLALDDDNLHDLIQQAIEREG